MLNSSIAVPGCRHDGSGAAQDDAGEQIGSHDRLDKEEGEQSRYSGGDFMGHPQIFRGLINEFFPPESRAHLIDDRDAVPGTFPSAPVSLPSSELGGEYQQSRRIETGGDKLVNILSLVMRVRPEGDRSLIVSLLGSEYRFAEI